MREAWKGMNASLLLHVAVAMGVWAAGSAALPARTPLVIDLTIGGPPGAEVSAAAAPAREPRRTAKAGRPVPSETPGTALFPEPPPLSAPTTLTKEAAVTAAAVPATLSDITPPASAPSAGTARAFPAAPSHPAFLGAGAAGPPDPGVADALAATGESGGKGTPGNPPGIAGARAPVNDFGWIRDAIQRGIDYPAVARKMGWEGKVVVAFRLLPDGSVRDVRVVQGSGHAALDRGAVDAVRNASPFARSSIAAEIITPVVYRMSPAP